MRNIHESRFGGSCQKPGEEKGSAVAKKVWVGIGVVAAILIAIGACEPDSDAHGPASSTSPRATTTSSSKAIDAGEKSRETSAGKTTSQQPTLEPQTSTAPAAASAAGAVDPARVSSARAALTGLEVKGKAAKTGYQRELFGERWSDDVNVEFGHNGCDTRNDILRRDLIDLQVRPGTHGCVAQYGILAEPYTGTQKVFDRGTDQASRIHIDHIVPLANAWVTGAQAWDPQTRANFANDPRNLRAVDGSENQRKRDTDAATWLPPNKGFRCEYAVTMIEVKAAYGLWVTSAERDALDRELGGC